MINRSVGEDFLFDAFARGGFHDRPAAPAPPEPPFLDPWFKQFAPPAPTALSPVLRWLVGDDDPTSELAQRLGRAFHAGRLLIGRCVCEAPDKAGRVIRMRQLRRQRDVPVMIDHRGPPLGVAFTIPRLAERDAVAAVVLDDSATALRAARIVAQGDRALSLSGRLHAQGGWNERDWLEVKELSLCASPEHPSCRVLNLNAPDFIEFLRRDLNISEQELPL